MGNKKLYINFLKKYAWKKKLVGYYIIIMGFIFLNTSISLVRPSLQGKIVDGLSKPANVELSLFMRNLVFFLGIFVVYYITLYIQRYVITVITEEIASDVRQRVYNKLCSVKTGFFNEFGFSDILLRIDKDVAVIKQCSIASIITLVSNIMIIIVIPPYMWKIHKGIAFSNLILLICVPFVNKVLGNRIKRTSEQALQGYNDLSNILADNYNNWFVIRMFQSFRYIYDKYDKKNQIYKRRLNKQNFLYNLNILSTIALQCLGTIVIWIVGVQEVFAGNMSVGTIMALMNYQGILMNPIIGIVDFTNEYHTAVASLKDINVLLSYPDIETEGKINIENIEKITLKEVTFRYAKAESKILQNVNYSFRRGTIYAIYGKSGKGKSTLFKLLVGICSPTKGEILINQNRMTDCNLISYWGRIGYVMQRTQFFRDTIKANLFYNFSDDRLKKNAQYLDLYNDICALPDRWETEIKIEPYNFSEGQMRRLDILRNILKEVDVLIFDEATANIDKKCRNNFYKLLHILSRDKIIIYSTHNKEELEEADVVINMSEMGGKV